MVFKVLLVVIHGNRGSRGWVHRSLTGRHRRDSSVGKTSQLGAS